MGRGTLETAVLMHCGIRRALKVASGFRCKWDGRGSGFIVMLGGGSDIFGVFGVWCGGYLAWPELAGWFEQRAAEILQVTQAVAGHGQAAPAAGGAVEDCPHEGEAARLAGEPANDLGAAAGLAEGPLDEVGVPDAVVVLSGEPQVGGQPFLVGEIGRASCRERV